MKPSLAIFAITFAALTLAGCAAANDTSSSSSEPREQPEYRTGSNLPIRTAKPKTKEERDRAAEEAERAQRDAEKILRPGT